MGLGLGVYGLGLRVEGGGSGVHGLGLRVEGRTLYEGVEVQG